MKVFLTEEEMRALLEIIHVRDWRYELDKKTVEKLSSASLKIQIYLRHK